MDPLEALFTKEVARGTKQDEDDFGAVLLANTLVKGKCPNNQTMRDLFFLDTIGFFDEEKKDEE